MSFIARFANGLTDTTTVETAPFTRPAGADYALMFVSMRGGDTSGETTIEKMALVDSEAVEHPFNYNPATMRQFDGVFDAVVFGWMRVSDMPSDTITALATRTVATGGMTVDVLFFSGIDQVGPEVIESSFASSGANISTNITPLTAGATIVDGVVCGVATAPSSTSGTESWTQVPAGGPGMSSGVAYKEVATTDQTSMGWTTDDTRKAQIVVSLAPAPANDETADTPEFDNKPVVERDTFTESNIETISGLGSGISVSATVSGGFVSKNGAAYTTDPITLTNGDTIALGHTSAAAYLGETTTTIDINNVVASFTSTTLADPATVNLNLAWHGAVTVGGFSVVAEPDAGSFVTIEAASDDQFTDIKRSVTSFGFLGGPARMDVSGLLANTTYHWRAFIVDGGSEKTGSVKTFPVGAANVVAAIASCANTGSEAHSFARIIDRNPDLFIHTGDLHYEDIGVDDASVYAAAYRSVLASAIQSQLYSTIPLAYMWDDHDYGPNNSSASATGRPAALETYRNFVPHYALQEGAANDTNLIQDFDIGRLRVVMLDPRSERVSGAIIGTDQKARLFEVLDGLETDTSRALLLCVGVPWVTEEGNVTDTWSDGSAERAEIANYIDSKGLTNRTLICAGDMHGLAIDDGTNNTYATNWAAGGPVVFQAAPLDQTNSVKGGPYSEGTIETSSQQYGVIEITDTGGTSIGVQLRGFSVDESTGAETETISLATSFTVAEAEPFISQVDDDNQVQDGQTNVAVTGYDLPTTGDVLLRSGTIETAQAVSARTTTGFTWDSVNRGELPYTTTENEHELVVMDGVDELTFAQTFDPPDDFAVYPLHPDEANQTDEESVLFGLGAITDSMQLKVPTTVDVEGSPAVITWETFNGYATGRVAELSVVLEDSVALSGVEYHDGTQWDGIPTTLTPDEPADAAAPLLQSAAINAAGTTLTLTFNEAVTIGVDGWGGFSLTLSGGTGTASYTSGDNSSTIVLALSRVVEEGETITVSYTQPGDGIQDAAGNVLASFSDETVTNSSTADVTSPTVTLSVTAGTKTGIFDVTVSADESITGLTVDDFIITNGTADSLAGSGNSYTLTVTPTADSSGSLLVDLPADSATDAAGNGNNAASQLSVPYDTTTTATQMKVTFTNIGAIQNSSSHPTSAGVARTSEANVSVWLVDAGSVVSYTTTNTTDASGILNDITFIGPAAGTTLTCFVQFSNGDGIPGFSVQVEDV